MTEITTNAIPAASWPETTWEAAPAKPWRRFWARCYDNALLAFGVATLGFAALSVADLRMAKALNEVYFTSAATPLRTVMMAALAIIPFATLLCFTGGSPGKWAFGIVVRRPDGSRLSFLQALRREWRVFLRGMAGGLPLVSLFFASKAYTTLSKEGVTSWDADGGIEVRYCSRVVGRIVAGILLFLLTVLLFFAVLGLSPFVTGEPA